MAPGTERPADGATSSPEPAVNNITRYRTGQYYGVCVDCGHEFAFDSSPDIDRCWSCSAEADRLAAEGRWPR